MKKSYFLILFLDVIIILYTIFTFKNLSHHFGEHGLITYLSFYQLLFSSFLALLIFNVRKHTKNKELIWIIICLGFLFMAIDEVNEIHENIDFGLKFNLTINGSNLLIKIDDLLIGIFAITGITLFFIFSTEIKIFKEAIPYFIVIFVFTFIMILIDLPESRTNIIFFFLQDMFLARKYGYWINITEEVLKLLIEGLIIGTFLYCHNTAIKLKK